MRAALLLVVVALFGCTSRPAGEGVPSPPTATRWVPEVVLEGKPALGGCAIGLGGVVAVCADRFVYLARWASPWQVEPLAQTPGEMIQVAVGDLLPDRPGDEILAVGVKTGREDDGGAGAAVLLYQDGGEWAQELIFEDSALLHGVCIVRGEAFVAGYGKRAYRLRHVKGTPPRSDATTFHPRGEGSWVAEPVADLPGAGRSAVATRGGVAFACRDGSVVLTREGAGGWSAQTLDTHGAGRARIGALDDHIVVSSDDGVLALLSGGPSDQLPAGAEPRELYRSSDKLRGAVLADLDPGSPGLEVATAGYAGELVLLRQVDGAFESVVLASAKGAFHHLACGELTPPPETPNTLHAPHLVLAGVTLSGQLIVVHRAP